MRTHEGFISELKIIHPNLLVLGNYVNSSAKILIEDEFGIQYMVSPQPLLSGSKPTITTAINKNLAFVVKLKQINPTLKILGKYVDNKTKILIKDDFNIQYLVRPNDLLNSHVPSIQTAVNKNTAFKIKLKQVQPHLIVVGEYINSKTKILIKDKVGILYKILPDDLLQKVSPSIQSALNKNLAFKIMSEQIHGALYDYSIVNYNKNTNKVKIICKICGNLFLQRAYKHLQGDGCPKCGLEKAQSANKKILDNRRKTIVDDITQKHDNRINCDKLIYNGNKIKSLFGCNVNIEHGYWMATPNDILDGCGCPLCKSSKGELKIASFLTKENINFIRQKTFSGCKDKKLLQFDFYLPNYNLCIEYDGEQHFKSVKHMGGQLGLNNTKRRDIIKNNFCEQNNINLIRIPFHDFKNIDSILYKKLFKTKNL